MESSKSEWRGATVKELCNGIDLEVETERAKEAQVKGNERNIGKHCWGCRRRKEPCSVVASFTLTLLLLV